MKCKRRETIETKNKLCDICKRIKEKIALYHSNKGKRLLAKAGS